MGFWVFSRKGAVKLGAALQPESGCGLQCGSRGRPHQRAGLAVYWRSRPPGLSFPQRIAGTHGHRQMPDMLGTVPTWRAPQHSPWPASSGRLFRHSTSQECA